MTPVVQLEIIKQVLQTIEAIASGTKQANKTKHIKTYYNYT